MRFLIVLISLVAVTLARPGYAPLQYGYSGPLAPIGHDGRVVDTPEVAHAKAAHLTAVAHATSKASYGVPYAENDESYEYNDGSYDYSGVKHSAALHGYSTPALVSNKMYHSGYGYHGPLAPLDHQGRVVDTPEVAHAKAAHFAAYNHAASNVAPYVGENYGHAYKSPIRAFVYHGSAAPLAHDGRVVDTPEVAQAKAAHLAAYANTLHGKSAYNDYGYY